MQKGFLSVVVVLALLLFLGQLLATYKAMHSGLEQTKNAIVLRQAVSEKIYSLEEGFSWTVAHAVFDLHADTPTRATEVCAQIMPWAASVKDSTMWVGYVNPVSYERITRSSCEDSLFVDAQTGETKVEDTALLDSPLLSPQLRGLLTGGGRLAFVFETNVSSTPVRMLVPEGTVIKHA